MVPGLIFVAAAERSSDGGLSTAVVIAGLRFWSAVYGAWLSTRNYLWQRKREAERRDSDIRIALCEKTGFDTDELVIGQTVGYRHTLHMGVVNGGAAPEYVYGIWLEGERPSPLTVIVRKEEGSVEVRPRDQKVFEFELGGRLVRRRGVVGREGGRKRLSGRARRPPRTGASPNRAERRRRPRRASRATRRGPRRR
jgi:hypothetical protein